jgi:hypothetical protein
MTISQLAVGQDVEKTNTDSLGGGYTKATGLYRYVVDVAYLGKSRGGAMSLNLHLKNVDDKSITRQTLWVTSGDAKGNRNYYVNQSGKKFLLPGMVIADQIAKITAGKPMAELTTEKKMIKLWDREAGAEKPTEVPVVSEMVGQPIMVGLHKIRENRRVNDGSGNYVPSREERLFNEIDKVFHPDGFSVAEKEANAEEPKFHKQWAEKYGDKTIDNYDPNVEDPADDSLPDAPAAETSDLFS